MPHSDSQTGTPVTLVVPPGQPPPATPPGHHPIPFTGFDLLAALLLAVIALALGSALLVASGHLPARLVPSRIRTTHSRRTS